MRNNPEKCRFRRLPHCPGLPGKLKILIGLNWDFCLPAPLSFFVVRQATLGPLRTCSLYLLALGIVLKR